MKRKFYHVIGVMSGTSLDGIDLAEVEFYIKNKEWHYRLKSTTTVPYAMSWKTKLRQADSATNRQVEILDEQYTTFLAAKIKQFINQHSLQDIDAICTHGHTVFHQPERQYTLQIGNRPLLAHLLQEKVVCDFRIQDVQLGGQGAPLVPLGDQYLFSHYQACINLGGFANISLQKNNQRIAYDVCPVNTVLNRYAQKCGLPFDKGGKIAKSGTIDKTLLGHFNQLSFYKKNPPKSLGIEWVKKSILPEIEKADLPPENVLATFTHHIAHQLAESLSGFNQGEVLLTGGGTFNDYLIERLQERTKPQLIIPEEQLIEYKEALIFAFLGVLKLREENNVLKSVTGASKDHSSGLIYSPTKF